MEKNKQTKNTLDLFFEISANFSKIKKKKKLNNKLLVCSFFVVLAHLRSFPKIKGDAPRHFDLLTRVYGSRHRPDLSSIGKT